MPDVGVFVKYWYIWYQSRVAEARTSCIGTDAVLTARPELSLIDYTYLKQQFMLDMISFVYICFAVDSIQSLVSKESKQWGHL